MPMAGINRRPYMGCECKRRFPSGCTPCAGDPPDAFEVTFSGVYTSGPPDSGCENLNSTFILHYFRDCLWRYTHPTPLFYGFTTAARIIQLSDFAGIVSDRIGISFLTISGGLVPSTSNIATAPTSTNCFGLDVTTELPDGSITISSYCGTLSATVRVRAL